nr:reverse transcriptase domain-containing protein [Tanacetum cinerariifolium]
MNIPISFPAISSEDISEEPLIIKAELEGYLDRWVYVDKRSLVEVMFEYCFENLDPRIKARLKETQTDLVRFAGEILKPLRKIELEACFGNGGLCRRTSMKFIVVRAPSPYNIILGRPGLKTLRAILSTIHLMMKFPTPKGKIELEACFGNGGLCRRTSMKFIVVRAPSPYNIILGRPGLKTLRAILSTIHLMMKFPTPKESVMGFRYKCFLDAYKGYHQIQMAEEDEEKTAFYTDQGTYCYTKMPFGLKNAGASYQRLVDSTFQHKIGRNLEAYVDDMVIQSKDEKMLLADIAKTFDNLKKINMKLTLKKCCFGVEEGKFIRYMVTSEGIRDNPKKTMALTDLQSSRTLKEMQSLSGKLVALNRFLAKSAERSLPFFNTLKNTTKENKHEYRWTKEAEEAF